MKYNTVREMRELYLYIKVWMSYTHKNVDRKNSDT